MSTLLQNAPRTYGPPPTTHRRNTLGVTATVIAIIRDVLLIVVLAAVIYFGGSMLAALSDAGSGSDPATPAAGWNRQTCQTAAIKGQPTPVACDKFFGNGG